MHSLGVSSPDPKDLRKALEATVQPSPGGAAVITEAEEHHRGGRVKEPVVLCGDTP